jgi:hypothetical protein
LLGQRDAAVQGGREGRAEQGSASVEGEILAGVEHGPGGGVDRELMQIVHISDGLLESQPFVIVAIFDGESGHRQSFQDNPSFLVTSHTT